MKYTSDIKYGSLQYCVTNQNSSLLKNRKKPQRKPRIRGKKFEVLIKDKNKWLNLLMGVGVAQICGQGLPAMVVRYNSDLPVKNQTSTQKTPQEKYKKEEGLIQDSGPGFGLFVNSISGGVNEQTNIYMSLYEMPPSSPAIWEVASHHT